MRKAEYLNELKIQLRALPANEVDDILRDQEEFIRDAMSAGKTEEQAIAGLGDPAAFAANLTAEMKIQRVSTSSSLKNQVSGTVSAVVAILALAPLNLIFVLGPFLALVAVAIAGWAVAFSGLLAACALFLGFFFKLLFIGAGFWVQISTFFFALGSIGASLLALIGMYFITQWLVLGTLAYLKWNLNFVRGRA
ncbi:MAG: DUF1700 domain-containing protein [Bdellovibrionota bacterium]